MFLQSSVLFMAWQKLFYLYGYEIEMKSLKYLSVLSICFLSACASHNISPDSFPAGKTPSFNETPQISVTEHSALKTSASQLSSWQISGAMAARNKQKGWSASLNWLQQGVSQYQIRLFGPLGGGTVIVTKQKGIVTYTDGAKKISSRNADELLMKETGVRLPVNNLYYWVRGLPAPGAVQSQHTDNDHNLSSLTQDGYTINYANYTSINHVSLPGKIQLQGNGVSIKLVIKHWKI